MWKGKMNIQRGGLAWLEGRRRRLISGAWSTQKANFRTTHTAKQAMQHNKTDRLCVCAGGDLADPVLDSSQSFIQRCEVQPFSITIDYQPHSVNIAALRR